VARFNFQHLKQNKPGLIQCKHKQKMVVYVRKQNKYLYPFTLLFLINEWIINYNAERIIQHTYFIFLLQILNITLAYQIHEDSITLLNRIIKTFLINFQNLYVQTH